jgi:hypothetical protein
MFTLRSIGAACGEFGKCMAKAYIDFTKAYDSINRHALWKALRAYGVHPKLIALLEDLHSDTFAAVRLAGKVGSRFRVSAGVRQGCVIAPTLFNVFIDVVVRKALTRMPENCGIKIQSQSNSQQDRNSFEHVIMLMYADDLVLMSHDPAELAAMLRIIDEVAREYGMMINASKTEIQIHQCSDQSVFPVNISTGVVNIVGDFKYLGSWMAGNGSMNKEISVRRGRALGVFHSYSSVWSNRKLQVSDKMAIYNSVVLPHLLYGCETWNCTSTQLSLIESAHSSCLRHIMGENLSARHSLKHIHTVCGSQPVGLLIVKRTFQWLGHVSRMPEERLPRMAYNCVMEGRRPRGRPRSNFRHTYSEMLKSVGVSDPNAWLADMSDIAFRRTEWRSMVNDFKFESVPKRLPTRRSARLRPCG